MGILNVTPDSFSDGGEHFDVGRAREYGVKMHEDGADIIDVGAESTRPGSARVSAGEQRRRIGRLIREIAGSGVVVSIDTNSPDVARWALDEGARIVNSTRLDVAAAMGEVVSHAPDATALVLMHSRGDMASMPGFSVAPDSAYTDVLAEVPREWRVAADAALDRGCTPDQLVFDPGLGFHKTAWHSAQLLTHLGELPDLPRWRLVGTGRKSFATLLLRAEDGRRASPKDRLGATIVTSMLAVQQGAQFVRVHDVLAVRQALDVHHALSEVRRGAHA